MCQKAVCKYFFLSKVTSRLRGLEPLWLSVFQFKKSNDDAFTFSKLTIVMEDNNKHDSDLIDEFTIVLSLSEANNVMHTGKE